MGFKFIKTLDPNNKYIISNVTFDLPSSDLTVSELLDEFRDFLRACGYQVNEIVEAEEEND